MQLKESEHLDDLSAMLDDSRFETFRPETQNVMRKWYLPIRNMLNKKMSLI
jgi:hypothetical protein